MTNIYDFLRRIQTIANASNCETESREIKISFFPEDIAFLNNFFQAPDTEIHFKARKVDEVNGEPVFASDLALSGQPVDLFCLITEAMLNNGFFAQTIKMAATYYNDHSQYCEECQRQIAKAKRDHENDIFDFTFKQHKK